MEIKFNCLGIKIVVLFTPVKIYILTLNEKSRLINSRTECVKDVKNIYWVKKDLFGCFRIEENATNTMKQV